MKKVGKIVQKRPLRSVPEDMSVHEAARFMTENKVGAVPVLAGERLVGVFSERDLMTRVVVPGRDPHRTLVRDVMTRDLVVAGPEDDSESCEAKMAAHGCRHLPVVEGSRVVGFLSLRDLLRSDLEEKSSELELMNHYVHHVPRDVEQRLQ